MVPSRVYRTNRGLHPLTGSHRWTVRSASMGFDKRQAAKKYSPKDGDTLDAIAQRETAAGNQLSAEDLALFNWGTSDPAVVDEHLRDELDSHKRGDDKRFVISADAKPRSDLLIPVGFTRSGLSVDLTHTVRVRRVPPPPPQFKACAQIPGVTFEFDKSFVRPGVVEALKALEEARRKNPDAKIMIFGHTDKVGSESYNKGLSERRAKSVYAFITNKPEIWEALYQEEGWGIKSVQEILADMGGDYDPGPVDGVDGPRTQAAVKNFQRDYGLTIDGKAGAKTRAKLFGDYMAGKHDVDAGDDAFMDPKHMGCGEFNPVEDTEEPSEPNRRVTFFLFHPDRIPKLPCKHADLGPCRRQITPPLPRYRDNFHCSFYDSIARKCPCEGPGPGPVPVVEAKAAVSITEILGLYKPGGDDRPAKAPGTTRNSGYVAGYSSGDDQGRVFTNRLPDGTWKKNVQYVEITVKVSLDPAGAPMPAGAKIRWSFEVPDDPSNQDPKIHPDVGKLLDPNDYDASGNVTPKGDDNDPGGKAKEKPKFAEADPKYTLAKNETLIDRATMLSKVRFQVSDVAGDTFRITALAVHPAFTDSTPASTGLLTVWHRVEIEYVKMPSATELPVEEIAGHYLLARVQVDVSERREVKDLPVLPVSAVDAYCSKKHGEFTHEGEGGWFFMVAATRSSPPKTATLLYEGEAEAHAGKIRALDAWLDQSKEPAVVRVFNRALIGGLGTPKPADRNRHIKFQVTSRTKSWNEVTIARNDYHLPESPDVAFLDADLSHYAFADGEHIPIQVLSQGDDALVLAGISPGGVDIGGKHFFGGKLIVYTLVQEYDGLIGTLCHELGHAFDNAHKCGNFDWTNGPKRTGCCLNYWFFFILDDAGPRKPIPWTQNRLSAEMCGPHIRRIRDFHLEDNPGLKWK